MRIQLRHGLSAMALGLAAWAGLGGRADAAPVVINFDSLTATPNAVGPVLPASELSNQLLAADGVTFSTVGGSPFVAVVNNGAGTTSPPNAIGGVDSAGNLSYATPFSVHFFLPGTSTTAATDSVAIFGDTVPFPGGGTLTLQAFDVNGALVGSDSEIDTGGTKLMVTAGSSIINSIIVSESGPSLGNVAFDDLTFGSPLVGVTAAVPEPSSLVLGSLAAVTMLGGAAIRRRRNAV